MLNEDDLRPGDVIQDAMGDFWHVHEDGKIWCSEPGARISFEHARSAGPFTRHIGAMPTVEKCINDGWQIRPFGTEVGTRWCLDVNDAIDRARDAEDECRYWTAVAEALELKQNTDPVESLAGEFKNAAHDAARVVVESLESVAPGLKFADVDALLADVSPEHWRTMARNVLDSSGGFDE